MNLNKRKIASNFNQLSIVFGLVEDTKSEPEIELQVLVQEA
jgi:hypothetical protein